MSTKVELEKIIVKLHTQLENKEKMITVIDDKVSESKIEIRKLVVERDAANKESGIYLNRLNKAKQSIITALAIKYPDESQSMFDNIYHNPNQVNTKEPNEELRLLRYLLAIVE